MRILAACMLFLTAAPGYSVLISWGDGAHQLGLRNVPEQERAGPVTFTVSPGNTIVVADSVHGAVKEFNPDGTYLRTVASNVYPSSMAYDTAGNLLLLEGHSVQVLSASGSRIRTLTIPADVPLVEGYGQEVFAEGDNIGVNDPDELVYVFPASAGDAPAAPARIDRGREVRAGQRAFTRIASRQTAELIDQPATLRAPGRTLSAPIPNITAPADRSLGAVLYRGVSSDGDLFIEVEELDAAGQVHLNVRRVGGSAKGKAAGAGLGQTELPNDYFTTIYKKFEVKSDGAILQMQTRPDGVVFTTRKIQP